MGVPGFQGTHVVGLRSATSVRRDGRGASALFLCSIRVLLLHSIRGRKDSENSFFTFRNVPEPTGCVQVPQGGTSLDDLLKSIKVGVASQGQKLADSDAFLERHRAERGSQAASPEAARPALDRFSAPGKEDERELRRQLDQIKDTRDRWEPPDSNF